MKEFTYLNLEEYLDKADKYDEPKIVKMFEVSTKEGESQLIHSVKALVYLRTALICWESKLVGVNELSELRKVFKEHGHAEGRVVEVTGIKF